MQGLGQSFSVILALTGGEAAHIASRTPDNTEGVFTMALPRSTYQHCQEISMPHLNHFSIAVFHGCVLTAVSNPYNPLDPRKLEAHSMPKLSD